MQLSELGLNRQMYKTVQDSATQDPQSKSLNDTLASGPARNLVTGSVITSSIIQESKIILRLVTDPGPMTATDGVQAEVVFNLSNSKAYVCTTGGTPGVWQALN